MAFKKLSSDLDIQHYMKAKFSAKNRIKKREKKNNNQENKSYNLLGFFT